MALVSSYLKRIPRWVQWAYPSLIWRVEGASKEVFLTFDDGPHPVVTRFVLDCLAEYNAKATFFCVGEQIERHPAIFEEIKNGADKNYYLMISADKIKSVPLIVNNCETQKQLELQFEEPNYIELLKTK